MNLNSTHEAFTRAVLAYCKDTDTEVECLLYGDKVYRLTRGEKSVTILDTASSKDSHLGTIISLDKMRTYEFLSRLSIPTVPTSFISRSDNIQQISSLVPYPAVVKPVDYDGGKGVTVNITSRKQLLDAIEKAFHFTRVGIVLQPFVEATNFRLQILGGKIAYVVHRMAKDLNTPLTIANPGGSRIELPTEVHPEVESYCKIIADKLSMHSYGIDILSNDIKADPGLVLEINGIPVMPADKAAQYVESLFA